MDITPVTPAARTAKVRSTKVAVSKSGKTTPAPKAVKPVAAAPRKRKTPIKKPSVTAAAPPADLTPMIAVAAYYLAERRNFVPGLELHDWLSAEQSILSQVAAS